MTCDAKKILSFFQSVLRWSVAVSKICCHSFRVVAFLQAVAKPKFRGPRSASIARSQVWLAPCNWEDTAAGYSLLLLPRFLYDNPSLSTTQSVCQSIYRQPGHLHALSVKSRSLFICHLAS